MKKLVIALTLLCAVSSTFTACNKDSKDSITTAPTSSTKGKARVNTERITGVPLTSAEVAKILALSSDPDFQALVLMRVAEYNSSVLNQPLLNTTINSGLVLGVSMDNYAIGLGYAGSQQLVAADLVAKNLEHSLETKFQLSQTRWEVVAEAIGNTNPTLVTPLYTSAKSPGCNTAYNAAIVSVIAETTMMHMGCLTLDISIIGGLICHGAATAYGLAGIATADAAYAACN